jgi:hypothetical protein
MLNPQQKSDEMETILEEMVACGVAYKTGEKRWSHCQQKMADVYTLVPGITYAEYRRRIFGETVGQA